MPSQLTLPGTGLTPETSFCTPAAALTTDSFQAFTPSFRVTTGLKVMSSRTPSPLGENPPDEAVRYTGVGRVSIWMPRSSLAAEVPALFCVFTTYT